MVTQSSAGKPLASGQQRTQSTLGEFNNQLFVIQQTLSKMQTATLVRIESCANSGGLSPVGFVDVTPMVNQVDGQGDPTPHVTVYNLPYFRIQGGSDGIIIDPKKGDIGIAVFASRDISWVKNTRKQGDPGSRRQYSFSDGMYLGGVLNGTPSQYIQFTAGGIKIVSPHSIVIQAPTVEIDASTSCTINTPIFTVNGTTVLNGPLTQGKGDAGGNCEMFGPLVVVNDVIGQGTSLHTHVHGGVSPGGSQTGVPST